MSITSLIKTFWKVKSVVNVFKTALNILKVILLVGLVFVTKAVYKYLKLKGR